MVEYPDLNELPSVLETEEVEDVLRKILATFKKDTDPELNEIVSLMVDSFFARGYWPDDYYDVDLCTEILEWVKNNWEKGDEKFAKYATTVLANIMCPGRNEYLLHQYASENRESVKRELVNCIEELKIST